MHIRCPHCHNPIEIIDDAPLKDVLCSSCGSSFSLVGDDSTMTYREKSRKFAHFELMEQLGIGAFGSVWKAKDTQLDRIVAVKTPRLGQLDADEAEMFLREARAAAQLKHPNIVSVHEIGRDDGQLYIVCDYIQGANLKQWLSGRRPTFREAAQLCAKIADALHHAHEKGVVHRDVKPSNVMIDDQAEPHIMDFGLAKRESGEITITIDGRVLGTPAYMSPEQEAGKSHQADGRADVYSLGVVLFELLTGELPFRGDKEMMRLQIRTKDPPNPRTLNSRIPRDLETICLKCLRKEPDGRYVTAAELASDLRHWLDGEPIRARPLGRVVRFWRWYRRHTIVVAGGFAVFYGLLAAVSVPVAVVLLSREEYPLKRAAATLAFASLGIWIGVLILRGARRALLLTFGWFGWTSISTLMGLAAGGMLLVDDSALVTIQFGMQNLIGAAFQLHAIVDHLRNRSPVP